MDFKELYQLDKCNYLGHGKNGKVYLMPNGKVVKICKSRRICIEEYEVLKAAEGSHFFPKAYCRIDRAMIRDYVDGEVLLKYIKKNGLSRKLAISLINLIEEFKKLGFIRLDIRGTHIYVQKDKSVMVIDPASHSRWKEKYPRLMLRDLRRLKVLKKFYNILREERPDLYKLWKR